MKTQALKKFLTRVLWLITYILLLVAMAYLPHYYNLPLFYVIAVPVIVAVIENSFAYFQKHISLFFARKLLTLLIALAVIMLSSVILFSPPSINRPMAIIQFCLEGFVVGIAIRELLLNMSLNNLFGESIDIQRLLFLSGIVIFLLLMPLDSSHGYYQTYYVFGFGAGLFAHFLLRRFFRKGADVSRRGKLLLHMVLAENETLSPTEQTAVRYFVKRRWRKLRKLFLRHLETMSTPSPKLAIIESCMWRIKGQYDMALRTLAKISEAQDIDTHLRGLLLLQQGLVLSELEKDEQMYAALNQSLDNNPNCFLSKITIALHLAEQIPPKKEPGDETAETVRPLSLIREALAQNAHERNTELLSNLIGHSVSLSGGFVQDAYGYALLKSGNFSFSKALFLDCIKQEPHLVTAYLHLGEWYLAYCLNRRSSKERLALANLCFSIALSLEGKRASRIARRARTLSTYVDQLINASS